MEPIKLIAMDMDGTLLADGGKGIPDANAQALRAAHEAGIHLALCSGRIPDDMGFYAYDLSLPMHILALNGTCTLNRPLGEIVRSDYLQPGVAAAILERMQGKPLHYGVFGDHELIISPNGMSREELEIIFGNNLLRKGTRTVLRLGGEGIDALLQRGVNKFMIFTEDDPLPLQELETWMKKELPQVEVSSSWTNNLEVNSAFANKGTALTALANELGIPLSQVMAIGDNDNDIPMLRAAGVGVAMGNASANAMAAADYATLPNGECGVAAAIRVLALGEQVSGVRRLR